MHKRKVTGNFQDAAEALEPFRDLAWIIVKSRESWWNANFNTVYLSEDQKNSAVEWMILEGWRSHNRPAFGCHVDSMMDALSTYEWMRWGMFPRRFHRFQRSCPWGERYTAAEARMRDGDIPWPFLEPRPNKDDAHYSPRVEYDDIENLEEWPVRYGY